MKNNTEKIGRYLQNEMGSEERIDFEKQLAYDKELQHELVIQKQIITAINAAGLKSTFGKAVRAKFISRMLIRWGIVALVVGSLVFYAVRTNMFSRFTHNNEIINAVPDTENFVIDNAKDTIIETEEGVVFGIPANAFGTDNKEVRLEIRTAISPEKIMLQGLSTTSNGELLQTAGMFYINGYVNEKQVPLVKKIDVSVPAKNIDPKMQLFNGVQDSMGRINWVNPKPIEKRLRTYDVTSLDFYPPYYIPVLKALGKEHTNKKYTDSLYYSFSGYTNDYLKKNSTQPTDTVGVLSEVIVSESKEALSNSSENFTELDGRKIFYAKCGSCHVMGKDFTGPNLQGMLSRWPNKQILKEWILNNNKATNKYPYLADKQNWSPTLMQVFEGLINDAEMESLIRWIDEWKGDNSKQTDTSGKRYDYHEVDPSRIRAIWDKKFNNTIIATKEFEERLQYMHTVCNPLLIIYLQNLDKPMYEIDELIGNNSGYSYEVQHKFLDFAARKDGGVMIKEGMQEKLSTYFEKKFKAYRDASAKTMAKYKQELDRLAAIADNKRREQETKDFLRKDKNFQEEFCANLTDAYRQIGVRRTYNDTIIPLPPPPQFYNIQIDTVGWKNLDMYVYEATKARESMTYQDPATGKTATVTYKEVGISIENQQEYDRVLVYLLPNGLSSFQRIDESGNIFKEKLNMLFNHDAIAIGFKGDKAYFYKQINLQPGKYTFRLSEITNKELKQQLKTVSKEKSEEMLNEYEYQVFEQQEIRREVQLKKESDFIELVKRAIWACGEAGFPDVDPSLNKPAAEGKEMGKQN